jgi:flagellin-like hook-associated protein FlgL
MNPLTSGTSTAASGILGSLGNNSSLISSIQTQLSTNQKILDPAQQGVVTRLNSQVTSFSAAHNNIAKAQNVLNVAATGLKSIASLLVQMQDLANKANDATMTTADAAKLQQTFSHLLAQVDTTASSSKIDSVGLMASDSADLSIQTGLTSADTTTIAAVNSDTTTLGIAAADISTPAGALAAIATLKTALDGVSSSQSSVAADQASLTSIDSLDSAISQNLQNTIDSIQKPDAAQLQMDLQNANNQQSMNYYLINQMNQEAQSVLTIFR